MGEIEKAVEVQEYTCLYPGCKETAISSHSQQKEGQLRCIAEDGIVYAPFLNLYRVMKDTHHSRQMQYHPIGVAKASVFKGFCSLHDHDLFSPIESEPLSTGATDQSFCLYLRGVSYEFCRKRRGLYRHTEGLKKCGDLFDPEVRSILAQIKDGVELYLRRDGSYYLSEAFRMHESGCKSELVTVWRTVPKNLQISTCICVNPLLEKYGEDASDLREDRVQKNLTFNIVPEQCQTHIIASWLSEHDSACAWVSNAFESPGELEGLINRFAFGESEETCVNPSFWKSIPDELKQNVLAAASHSHFSFDPPPATPTLVCL